jgi:hypothetical protein
VRARARAEFSTFTASTGRNVITAKGPGKNDMMTDDVERAQLRTLLVRVAYNARAEVAFDYAGGAGENPWRGSAARLQELRRASNGIYVDFEPSQTQDKSPYLESGAVL